MNTYQVEIPGKGTFEISSERELSNEEVYQAVISQESPQKTETPPSIAREAGILARGTAPIATLTTAGALMGAPLGPAGAAAGALAGGVAIPIADALTALYNMASRSDVQMPSEAIQDFMTNLGYPVAESRGERMLQAGGEALTGSAGGVKAAGSLAKETARPVIKGVSEMLAAAPNTQIATAAPAAATAQYVTEATGSPLAGMVAGTAVGAPGGVRPGRSEKGLQIPEIKQQASAAYKTATEAGMVFKPSFVEGILNKMKSRLSGSADDPLGYDPGLHSDIPKVLQRFEDEVKKGRFFTLQEIDNLRQVLKAPASNFNIPKQQRITAELIDIFDQSLMDIPQNSTIFGNKDKAVNAITQARNLYSKQMKLQAVEDLVNRASITAGGFSQSGMDNALRTEFASLAKNKKRMAQFNAGERAEIENIAKGGGNLEKMMRFVGKFAVRGPVTGAVQAVVPGGGIESVMAAEAAKRSAEALRQQNVQRLMDQISLGRTPEKRTFELLPSTTLRGLLSSQYGTQE